MRVAFIDLCGFRGYRKRIRIDFAERFTIIDGRNGAGKSTLFDAIEFVLTGSLSKYADAKAAGETVTDYLWWTGDGPPPEDRYVEVGFCNGDEEISLRRTQLTGPDSAVLERLKAKLCDLRLAPTEPLDQLCVATIIRDEHITALSLDLREADRYTRLRDALGAIDSDVWISRAADLLALAKRRTATAQQEVANLKADVSAAARRLDQVRANLVADAAVSEAVDRLRVFADTEAALDVLPGPVRERIASLSGEVEALENLSARWSTVEQDRSRLVSLSSAVESANAEKNGASAALEALPPVGDAEASSSLLATQARDLIALVSLGRRIGLREGSCPLRSKSQSDQQFNEGIAVAERIARRLDEQAARAEELERARRAAEARLTAAERAVDAAESARFNVLNSVRAFDEQREAQGFGVDVTVDQINARAAQLRQSIDAAHHDLRILETLRLSGDLERAQRTETDTKNRLLRAEERFGRARRAETIAQALHDAARRAAHETLDSRLERVLPLMSELYRRLRPHPTWSDIEYSIRGDVKRFLRLQVGEDLNPQFLFSSGQRRATGLAFLLSVNLSLAWSRWESILLDDPVQHIDDFRTIHLAEVTAQLIAEGRQIICAVEDAALADLLCRRLPVGRVGEAKRVTLGPDPEGALSKLAERSVIPLQRRALFSDRGQSAVG